MYINDLPTDINFLINKNSYRLNIDTEKLKLYQIFESEDDLILFEIDKNNSIKIEYEGITKKYSDDYFCEPMKKTLKLALLLIESIKNGDFEYDTCLTDRLLWDLRYAVNEIDI